MAGINVTRCFIRRTLLDNFCQSCKLSMCIQRNFATKASETEIPVNLLAERISADVQPGKGVIYDKRPFKMICDPARIYAWCTCGRSKGQPLCDGTHRNVFFQIKLRPVMFRVAEKKEYWLCNCKQTSNRPFCDGTHRRQDIQDAIKA